MHLRRESVRLGFERGFVEKKKGFERVGLLRRRDLRGGLLRRRRWSWDGDSTQPGLMSRRFLKPCDEWLPFLNPPYWL